MLRDPHILDHTLAPGERRVVTRLVEVLREEYGPTLERAVVFGSRARGDVGPDSDIDLLVLLRVPLADEGAAMDRVWDLMVEVKREVAPHEYVPLAPIVLAAERFEHLKQRERRFALDVETEGIAL
ncbi:MAG TPA: nucleotidyltransferase domain-containing protein [Polyangia bacterium]